LARSFLSQSRKDAKFSEFFQPVHDTNESGCLKKTIFAVAADAEINQEKNKNKSYEITGNQNIVYTI
jgi:hypothetical protein